MNFCGECGARLDPRDQTMSFCPECGAALDPIRRTTAPASGRAPIWGSALLGGTAPASRRGWGRIMLVALAALLVLAAASAVILALHGLPGASGSPPTAHGAGGSRATQTDAVSPSTTPGSSPTATLAPGATATTTVSATADPVGTITAQPSSPVLSVNPTTIQCGTTNPVFVIENSGGGILNWTASSSYGYAIAPQSGSLSGGEQTSVTVSHILVSGKITIAAQDGVAGSPQSVTVNCLTPV